MNHKYNTVSVSKPLSGKRWYCVFFGYFSDMSAAEMEKIMGVCRPIASQVIPGDKRLFIEVSMDRAWANLGTLQFKLQRFAETWGYPFHLWQWGVGKTLAESWVQTRWKSLTPNDLPLEALDDFAYPLLSTVTASKSIGLGLHTYNVLRCLGYQTLADLKEMPHDLLMVRMACILNSEGLSQNAVLDDQWGTLQENWLAAIADESLYLPVGELTEAMTA